MNVSPCTTTAPMPENSVSPSGERTINFVFSKNMIIAVTFFGRRPYASSIFSTFPLCVESNTSEKFMYSVVSMIFRRIPSKSQRIGYVVDCYYFTNRSDFSIEFSRFQVGFDWDAGDYKPKQL